MRDDYMHRLDALALYGRHTEAVAAAADLARRWPEDSVTQYGCARVHALAAGAVKSDETLANRYAAGAVALLRTAAKAGFQDGQLLLKDPDLNALHGRKDFMDLLGDPAKKP
jgi:hypothetical protein